MSATTTPSRDIIVIGASAGGLAALTDLARGLPRDLPAAIFIVVHTSPDNPSVLPQILGRAGPLPAATAVDREPIVPGRIYIAPPDHHLILKRTHVRVARGPKENGFRPAVDPLFRTAAHVHGPRVIGVILSGGLDDGTHGLALIVQHGGLAIVQDPQEAVVPSMPMSALQAVAVHRVLRAADIGPALARFVHDPPIDAMFAPRDDPPDVAEVGDSLQLHTPPGTPSRFTCPECGGALWESPADSPVLRFRCHVGHGYTAEALLADQSGNLEATLWSALRALEEQAALYRRMVARTDGAGLAVIAGKYAAARDDAEQRAAALRALLRRSVPTPLEDPVAPSAAPPSEPPVDPPA